MGIKAAGVELQRAYQLQLRARPVPLKKRSDPTQRGMRFGKLRIQFDRRQGGSAGRRFDLFEASFSPYSALQPSIGQPRLSGGIVGSKLNGALEVLNGLLQIILIALKMRSSPQVSIVRLRINAACRSKARSLLRGNLYPDLICDRARHF